MQKAKKVLLLLSLLAAGCQSEVSQVAAPPQGDGQPQRPLLIPSFQPHFSLSDLIKVQDNTGALASYIPNATSDWNNAVLNYFSMPRFATTGTNRTIVLVWGNGSDFGASTWYCASTDTDGLTIHINRSSQATNCGNAAPNGFTNRTQASGLSGLIAHELSHSLGFVEHISESGGLSPVSSCLNALDPVSHGFNSSVCQWEVQRLFGAYGYRATTPSSAQYIVTGVSLPGGNISVAANANTTVNAELLFDRSGGYGPIVPNASDNVSWAVSDPNIASLSNQTSSQVTVTGLQPGSVTLTATFNSSSRFDKAEPFGLVSNPNAITVTVTSPRTMTINAGNSQSTTVNTNVTVAPSVLVKDNGIAVQGVLVTFAVTGGGGSTVPANGQVSTNASGIATLTSWKLGTTAGANALTATASLALPVVFSATGVAGAAKTIALYAGNNQTAVKGSAVAVPPSVLVTDTFSNPVSGRSVTFSVFAGGGSLTGGSQTTNSSGIATVGSWTLGPNNGTNTLRATATGLTGSPVSFNATAITLNPPTAAVLTACSTYLYGDPTKTYVDYTIAWTAGSGNPAGTGFEIGESTASNPAGASIIRSGTTATTIVIGSYLVQAGTAVRYVWVRHKLGTGVSAWAQLDVFPLHPANGCEV